MPTIGFVLSHEQFPAPELIELGVAAEEAGFDALWTSDHFHPWQDDEGHAGHAWITLAALGQRTRLPFGTGVTCPTYRYHPSIVAQAFATLGQLYPGRVFLGLGSGEAVNEFAATGMWGTYQERIERLEEAVEIIRRLWAGEWLTFRGRHFQVHAAHLYDRPSEPIPIYISGTGPRSAELVGRIGDGLVGGGDEIADPKVRNAWEDGLRTAGADRNRQQILAEIMVVVGGATEAREAADKWRFQPQAWNRYVEVPDPRTIAEEAKRLIPPEDAIEGYVLGDSPEPHVRKLVELFRAGATQVFVHSGQSDQRRVIEFYGREVLPAVRRELRVARAA
jgi:F420-dependent hydroxymycolic acid dehydrogenase